MAKDGARRGPVRRLGPVTARVGDSLLPLVQAGAERLVQAGADRIAGSVARFDPERRAAAVDARLDDVRSRLEAMAAGREPRGEHAALAAELRAAREELDRVGHRLEQVRRHTLQARLAAYQRAVASVPEGRGRRLRRSGREAGLMAGTAAVGMAALQGGPGLVVGAGAGLAAAGGMAGVAARNRVRRKDRRAAIGEALTAAEAGLPRLGEVPVAELGRRLHELSAAARGSGRLPVPAAALLATIGERLDALLVRSLAEDLGQDVVHLVRASITDYLPDSLDPFLALPDPAVRVGGRSAADELTDQLAALDRALAAAADRTGRDRHADALLVQGEFLRSKFGPP